MPSARFPSAASDEELLSSSLPGATPAEKGSQSKKRDRATSLATVSPNRVIRHCARKETPSKNSLFSTTHSTSTSTTGYSGQVVLKLYSCFARGDIQLIWCEKYPGQDGFTQYLASDIEMRTPQSINSRLKIFMYGSKRDDQGRAEPNKESTFPRRFYLRVFQPEKEDAKLILQEICAVRIASRGPRACLFLSNLGSPAWLAVDTIVLTCHFVCSCSHFHDLVWF